MSLILAASIVLGYWFNITPPFGEYDEGRVAWTSGNVREKSVMVFDRRSAEEVIHNFDLAKANGRPFYLDIEHRYEQNRKNVKWDDILGTVERLRLADDGSIQALIVFYEEGWKAYMRGDYIGLSPAFYSARAIGSTKSRPVSLSSVAATNRPYIKSLLFKDCGKEEIDKEQVERQVMRMIE